MRVHFRELKVIASTKGRYALRVLVDMAESVQEGEYVALKDVASRQGISEKYLEAIMKILVQKKLVEGHRGKGGGYRLVRPAKDYTAGEIIRAAEGDIAPVSCLAPDAPKCERYDTCRTVGMWEHLDKLISDYLDSVRLTDLIPN